ncbi:AMP-binding protein [Falsihalocynthiibacter sp. BN13B15]|uniref:AMP-binding protein n=1 Tax=Falsihalocynthiibacter sp. BN13B15 TaxID=3240871 RepID=UPI00350F0300
MTNLLDDFAAAVAKHPDRVAIVDGKGREVTFAQLKERADGFARTWHARGIRRGDKVLLAMSVDADLYAALAALWSLGATAVLPEPVMGLTGLRHAARATNISAFCSSGLYGLLKWITPALWARRHLRPHGIKWADFDLHTPDDSDIALISFTSGTTGAPKAIPRSHAFLSAQHRAIAPLLQSAQDERDIVAFPVFVLINIASGRTSILPNWKMSHLDQLTPEQLAAWIASQNITRALLPPSLCEKLTQANIPASLHTVFTGGGPVFPDALDRLTTSKPDLKIVCVYGSTEAEPIAHLDAADISSDDRTAMAKGRGLLVGRPVEDIRLRIIDYEIQVAGDHVNSGYLDPRQNVENKVQEGATIWHRTGDAGYLDDRGRLWLLGRMGSQVFLAGRATFPFSVEVAVRQWDGVDQCALMSVENESYLVIEGDPRHETIWQKRATEFDIDRVVRVAKMPMDKRHASKIDRNALQKMIAS